jgi:hypothetical protein
MMGVRAVKAVGGSKSKNGGEGETERVLDGSTKII